MEDNVFKVLACDSQRLLSVVESPQSLHEVIDKFINSEDYALFITKASSKSIKIEMQKYYNAKYKFLTKRYKANKITQQEYKEALTKLKEIKNTSSTFEEYKKH